MKDDTKIFFKWNDTTIALLKIEKSSPNDAYSPTSPAQIYFWQLILEDKNLRKPVLKSIWA